jgi:hypothetical protein
MILGIVGQKSLPEAEEQEIMQEAEEVKRKRKRRIVVVADSLPRDLSRWLALSLFRRYAVSFLGEKLLWCAAASRMRMQLI